jgi:hypothetical protein
MSIRVELNNSKEVVEIATGEFVYLENRDNPSEDQYIDDISEEKWRRLTEWEKELENLVKEFPLLEKT